jgi:hypothetical protein
MMSGFDKSRQETAANVTGRAGEQYFQDISFLIEFVVLNRAMLQI